MKKVLLFFVGAFFFCSNIFADSVTSVTVSPAILTNLSAGTTISVSFKVEVNTPFGGSSNACTVWDATGISIMSSTRIDLSSLAIIPASDSCPSAITGSGAMGCPTDENTAVNGTLTFKIDDSANTGPWDITFSIDYYDSATSCQTITYPLSGSVLPVELISFDGKTAENGVDLTWATAQEINNEFFTLERSINGKDFEEVADIEGAGFSDEEISYEFLDTRALELNSDILYYRLKQTDFDGQFGYSEIINVRMEGNQELEITSLAAAKGMTNLGVNSANDEEIIVTVFDLSGKLIRQQEFFLLEGDNQIELQHSINQSGIYLYNLTSANGSVTKKFFH